MVLANVGVNGKGGTINLSIVTNEDVFVNATFAGKKDPNHAVALEYSVELACEELGCDELVCDELVCDEFEVVVMFKTTF